MKYYFGSKKFIYLNDAFFILYPSILVEFVLTSHKINSFAILLMVAFTILWVLYVYKDFNLIISRLHNKPILEFNEYYIYDCLGAVKYYWTDIDEVIPTIDYLEIHLYDFNRYLNKIKNPIYRLVHTNKRKKYFKIDLDYIKGNLDELLKLLNAYSIKAMELVGDNPESMSALK